jgi:integrase
MKNVNVYPFINKGQYRNISVGEIVGYVVDEGVAVKNGKKIRKRTTFKTEGEAKAFAYKIDVAREAKQLRAVGDLGELMALRPELLHCKTRLDVVGATFSEAVNFYLTYKRSNKGEITVGDAMTLFQRTKKEQGCSDRYLWSLDKHHGRFLKTFKRSDIMNSISTEQIYSHVYGKHFKRWGSVTRDNYIRNLNVLFNFCVKREYLTINPVAKVDRPKKKNLEPGFLTVEDTQKLLAKGIELEMYDRVAVNVLVLFCGVRVEEASKMKWSNLKKSLSRVTVDASIAKMNQRRINYLPDNAKAWLELCVPERDEDWEKPIIDGDWEGKMSLLRKKAGITYTNNAMRHSFATYHVALYKNAHLTSSLLGHVRDVNVLFNHYRNVVSARQGVWYFDIQPEKKDVVSDQTAPS